MAASQSIGMDGRSEPRDEVLHRAVATIGDAAERLTIVNVSPGGFMARTDAVAAEGMCLTIAMPGLGMLRAEVRWALGGRIGCRFDDAIDARRYAALLAAISR